LAGALRPKKRPHCWGHVSRGQDLEGLSGKAMQVAVPSAGTVLREMLNGESSEGHCFGFAASYYIGEEHLPSQRPEPAGCGPAIHK
jgi:hypothetical protein